MGSENGRGWVDRRQEIRLRVVMDRASRAGWLVREGIRDVGERGLL